MPHLRVSVKRLNKRKSVPAAFPDKEGIIGEVFENFMFEGDEVLTRTPPNTGKWYKDRDGAFYWGGGLSLVIRPPVLHDLESSENDWWISFFNINTLSNISRGENVKVAILDSGLDYQLGYFEQKQNIVYYNAFLDSEKTEDCLDNDGGHGTNCAGIVCAQGTAVHGVAPDAELLVIKVTDEFGGRDTGAILRGLRKAIALNCDVISLSFQIRNNEHVEIIHAEIKRAFAKNITVVAAVGNSGNPTDSFPASFPECLSIGGIKADKTRSDFSSPSRFLDLMGPGEEITSFTSPSQKIAGTSYSTPFAAGAIALIKSVARKQGLALSNEQLFDALKRSANKQIPNYNSNDHGFGIIDPEATLKLLITTR